MVQGKLCREVREGEVKHDIPRARDLALCA